MNGFSLSSSSRAQVCISIWAQTQEVPVLRVNKDYTAKPIQSPDMASVLQSSRASSCEHLRPARASHWILNAATARGLSRNFYSWQHSVRAIISKPPIKRIISPRIQGITYIEITILAEKHSNLYWYFDAYLSE